MQNIEINTTQNVRITYEVAHLGDRISAFGIDFLIMGAAALIVMLFSAIISDNATGIMFYLMAAPIFIFYNLISEITLNGQTIGKRALNIKVVKINGKEAQNSDYFLRWIFRMIDIYLSSGTVAIIFISTSKKSQRLGDLVSETTVIRIKPGEKIKFDDLSKMHNFDNYQPVYPLVRTLSEKDMLLIQSVIQRYKKYPNEAHTSIINEVVDSVKKKLRIEDSALADNNNVKFLSTLIKDYISLTR